MALARTKNTFKNCHTKINIVFDQFQESVSHILQEEGIKRPVKLLTPPNPDLGDFCIIVNQIAGKEDPEKMAENLLPKFKGLDGLADINLFNTGGKKKKIIYLNFIVSDEVKQKLQAERIKEVLNQVDDENYGNLPSSGKKIIVEHTSANPISPIHVGNLRNSIQGDTFARILRHAGHEVYVHYYVNDVGLQIGFVVVGYELVRSRGIKPPIKIDLWTGQIYAIMNCFYTIQKMKQAAIERGAQIGSGYRIEPEEAVIMIQTIDQELQQIQGGIEDLEARDKLQGSDKKELKELKISRTKLQGEIADIHKYQATYVDLSQRFSDLFEVLYEEVGQIDLIEQVSDYLKAYESDSNEEITMLFREVVSWVLAAFEWTLKRFNIEFDQFDFESEVTWSGRPTEIIDLLAETENAEVDGLAVRYSYPSSAMKAFMKASGLSKNDLSIRGQVPDLQLRRSDGTALYAAKDIAYSLVKFEQRQADRIYNVISAEQNLPQFQMLLPLHELGYTQQAANLKHYSYDNVDLLGRTMSGRLAKYITADDYYDESYIRARMAKRVADAERDLGLPSGEQEWDEENGILRAVTLASTRFPLVETNPKKRIELDLDRELDFKRNAGPFVQYAHARTNSLLEKVAKERNWQLDLNVDFDLLANFDTVEICDHLADLEKQIQLAADGEDPSKIAQWVFQLAQLFMKFYEKYPVLKADEETGKARAIVVAAIRKGIATGLDILGIPAASRL